MVNMVIEKDFIIFLAKYDAPDVHRHFAKQLFFSLKEDFTCRFENDVVSGSGICIASNVVHTVSDYSKDALMVFVEETSEFSSKLELLLNGADFYQFPVDLIEEIRSEYLVDRISGVKRVLQKRFELEVPGQQAYDKRVQLVLDYLLEMETIEPEVYMLLSRMTGLSYSRLSHLFREQVKISLSGYIVLVKMRKASEYVLNGASLTEAALHAGFSSSSHLSATCRRMFGMALSDFFNAR